MKLSFVFSAILASLVGFSVQAAEVTGASISGDELTVNVRHGGGCGDHKYELELRGCAESMPVQCQAVLKHTTQDYCEAILSRKATFSLKHLGLTDGYYANGSLTIKGANKSSATVRLPAGGPSRPEPRAGGRPVECVTHTDSIMTINEAAGSLSLETTSGETANYSIVDIDVLILESMPPVEQKTYALDDGRKVVISFRGEQKTGTGYFIRLNGEVSPQFKSCRR